MVENADSMSAPAKKETETRALPLLTYSVLGKENCVGGKKNNFAPSFAASGRGLLLCTVYYGSVHSPVDATVQLSRLVGTGGSDPTNFLGG